jgi:predicted ATPase/class 3 adenylate cyclase
MDPTRPLPEGTVTFLFTDIEGSTRLLQHLGAGYAAVREEHRRLLRAAFQAGDGRELGTEGDSFFVVFPTAPGAVAASVAAQRALAAHPWPEGAPVRVRMGLHTGTPTLTLGEYVGLDVHRAARISAAGHGGQILLSQSTRSLVEHDLPEGAALRDLGAHRLKDLQQPEHLYQVVVADLPAEFPPLRSLGVAGHNLPIQLTRFIGRGEEMAEVRHLLSTRRLVTLTGTGGCGKTRLALQVAAELVEDYKDGVWLVELAALGDPALVPQAVASVLGVGEEPGRLLPATLADALRPKRLLLLLDNCEHLVEACARLAEGLLKTCPQLRILATSREALGIAGEAAWRVPSLSVPEPRPVPSAPDADWVATLTQHEAVRLFLERAQQSQPRFALTRTNAPALAQVCRQLDGMPLAIELAAVRTKVLSVEQMAARLDDRFRLLTGGSRTALPRQQTLRATMDWSYDLLSEAERALLCRLSVFSGGFTLEAAEAVCAGNGVAEDEVLDLLSQLADKSLVMVQEQGSEVRYRLLETIRQYGAEKLGGSAEALVVRGRHRDWFLALAERAEPELEGPDQREWLDQLEVEHDNLRSALGWSLESKSVETELRLAGALWRFWMVRGHLLEGRKWLEGALERSRNASATLRAKAFTGAGSIAWSQADYEGATRLHGESLALYQALGDKRGIAFSLNNLAAQALDQGDCRRASPLLQESLALYRKLMDKRGIARILHNLAVVAYYEADYGAAQTLLEESMVIQRELRNKREIAVLLYNLGEVAQFQADFERASVLQKEGLALSWELGDLRNMVECLEGLAGVAGAQEQPERAARLLGAAEALRELLGARLPAAERAQYERRRAVARAGLGEEAFAAAWAQGRAMTLEQAVCAASETAGGA